MVLYSLRTLVGVSELNAVILVVAREQRRRAAELLEQHGPWPVPVHVVEGGTERQDSVAAGLQHIGANTDLVLIHDAARPFASLACMQSCIAAAATSGAAIVALAARDTVKVVDARRIILQTLDRQTVWLAQTPQVFNAALLRRAHREAQADASVGTDDAALVERLGTPVTVVPGEWSNHKITTPEDLDWAEWYARSRQLTAES